RRFRIRQKIFSVSQSVPGNKMACDIYPGARTSATQVSRQWICAQYSSGPDFAESRYAHARMLPSFAKCRVYHRGGRPGAAIEIDDVLRGTHRHIADGLAVHGGGVRCHQHIFEGKQRVVLWRRLLAQYIETGARNVSRAKCRRQVLLHDQLAPSRVDQKAAW